MSPGAPGATMRAMHDHPAHETRHDAGDALRTHRHGGAYAALVVEGSHVETSADGPIESAPGTLILHPRYHAHGNRFGRLGARVINLELPESIEPSSLQALRVEHIGEALDVFRRAPEQLGTLIVTATHAMPTPLLDWQPEFLGALMRSELTIEQIARQAGVSIEHASRSFQKSHGMSPQNLRRELRCRRALILLSGNTTLADVAADSGFADQSHLTRTVRAVTGLPPARLRRLGRHINCVQDALARAVR